MEHKTIFYRERVFLDKYKCVDFYKILKLYDIFTVGGLLYGYEDKTHFCVRTISADDIIEIV